MSLQFSDTTTKKGILQTIERLVKLGDGGITGNTTRLAEFTADVNLALDKVWSIIFKSGGKWQFDDSNNVDSGNNPDYPIITTNLVLGQRDYTFTTDDGGHLILDIYKVMVKNPTSGYYEEIYPVDQQSDEDMASFYSGQDTTGTPSRYDKTSNGIFLDCVPNYNSTAGLKIFINREGTYFETTDTTMMPGFSGLFHKYLALYAAYQYAQINQLANKNDLYNEMTLMEAEIQKHYRDRGRDEVMSITSESVNSI